MAQQRFWPHQFALIVNSSAVFSDFCLLQRCKYYLCLEKYDGVETYPIGDFLFITLQLFSEWGLDYFSIDLSQGSYWRIFHSHRGSAGKTWLPASIWLVVMWFFVYCDWWCKLCGYVGQDVFAKMQWWSIPQPNLNKWGLGVVQTSVLTNRIIHPNSKKNLSLTVSGWHL